MKKLLLSALLLGVSGIQAAEITVLKVVTVSVSLRAQLAQDVLGDFDAIDADNTDALAPILADFQNQQVEADQRAQHVVDAKIAAWMRQCDPQERPMRARMLQEKNVRQLCIEALTEHWRERSRQESNKESN